VHFEAGYVPAKHSVDDFAQALRAIGEPIHGQRANEISMARLLTLLFEVTELFDMQTRPELLLVQKTMVVVEGVSRTLDPAFDMWSTSEPVVRDWIERYLGPAGRLEQVADGAGALGRLVGELPRLAERAERLSAEFDRMGENGIRLDAETIERIGRSEAHASRWGRAALWVIAAVAVLVGLKILF
jgi:ubiquinone biosynthesis protein